VTVRLWTCRSATTSPARVVRARALQHTHHARSAGGLAILKRSPRLSAILIRHTSEPLTRHTSVPCFAICNPPAYPVSRSATHQRTLLRDLQPVVPRARQRVASVSAVSIILHGLNAPLQLSSVQHLTIQALLFVDSLLKLHPPVVVRWCAE
jgi:hypothetical protein